MPEQLWRLSNRPLLDTRTDAALFVGRERELAQLERAIELGLNVLLTSDPGVGKTSVVRQLARRRREAGLAQPVYVAGPTVTTPSDLFELVAEVLDLKEALREVVGADPLRQLDALADGLERRRAEEGVSTPTIVVDGPAVQVAYACFGRLRDEVWQVPLTWIVAIQSADSATLLAPPADAFFEIRVELAAFEPAELAELLRRRLPAGALPDDVIAELAELGDPRRVLHAARQLLTSGGSWSDLKRDLRDWDDRVGQLSRSDRMALSVLEELGGSASASDRGLLDRLGWTRSRAVQVLGGLENAGVLDSDAVRSGGSGRPRKVYRLRRPGAA